MAENTERFCQALARYIEEQLGIPTDGKNLAERAELAQQIRVIETIGPSPVPPWVISRQVPAGLRNRLRPR